MSPIDLMLASLGACTSMTMRMYAERKGWPLTDVAVKLRLRKVDAADCPGCTAKTGKIDRIDREIELSGALDDEQRRRLLAIADHCPVHKIMLGEKVIVSRLAGEVPEDDPVHG
ncbi:MAG: OsmC family protein [Rhodospirillales bacterium]|nr:OsmC family protein [Rhodospirillales bacterium]